MSTTGALTLLFAILETCLQDVRQQSYKHFTLAFLSLNVASILLKCFTFILWRLVALAESINDLSVGGKQIATCNIQECNTFHSPTHNFVVFYCNRRFRVIQRSITLFSNQSVFQSITSVTSQYYYSMNSSVTSEYSFFTVSYVINCNNLYRFSVKFG